MFLYSVDGSVFMLRGNSVLAIVCICEDFGLGAHVMNACHLRYIIKNGNA